MGSTEIMKTPHVAAVLVLISLATFPSERSPQGAVDRHADELCAFDFKRK